MDAQPEPTTQEQRADVLARDGNWAVVHLPGRRFPAVAVQGDTLSALRDETAEALEHLAADDVAEATWVLNALADRLGELLGFYEKVLGDHGLRVPYAPEA